MEYVPELWSSEAAVTRLKPGPDAVHPPNFCFLRLAAILGLEYRAVLVHRGSFDKPLSVDAKAGVSALLEALGG